jgi:hypothetical protein
MAPDVGPALDTNCGDREHGPLGGCLGSGKQFAVDLRRLVALQYAPPASHPARPTRSTSSSPVGTIESPYPMGAWGLVQLVIRHARRATDRSLNARRHPIGTNTKDDHAR